MRDRDQELDSTDSLKTNITSHKVSLSVSLCICEYQCVFVPGFWYQPNGSGAVFTSDGLQS